MHEAVEMEGHSEDIAEENADSTGPGWSKIFCVAVARCSVPTDTFFLKEALKS